MSIPNKPCDWCVGIAIVVFAASITAIVASGIVIAAQVLPTPCVRAGYAMPTDGGCQ